MEKIAVGSLEIYHDIQPIVDIKAKRIHGYEFLLRSPQWQNPEMLFSKAMENNYLYELDMVSIFTIIENAHKRNFNGGYLFINVYPSTFIEPIFFTKLLHFISLTKINKSSIIFELNESEKIVDLAALKQVVRRYREEGFLISIDDLGKGEATIQTVLEIQPDIVKLDRYFSEDLSKSKEKQKVIELLLEFFNGNTLVVLEGIEFKEDLHVAQQLGVELAQGYYFGRPNPLEYYHQKSYTAYSS